MNGWFSFIPLTQGKYAIVDTEDLDKVSDLKWYYYGGYAKRVVRMGNTRRVVYMHRVITNASDGQEVDHINGLKYDNRKSNLRLCNRKEQQFNMSMHRDNKSGYKGVSFQRGKWRARLTTGGKEWDLGRYGTPLEAAKAYNEKAKELFGEFAYLNPV